MTSSVLLCNNSPSVINQLNLSLSGEKIGFYFYSNYDQTSGIIWRKKKVHNAFYAPGLKGPPGASSVWIVRLSVHPSICLSVRLSVIPSRLQSKCNI